MPLTGLVLCGGKSSRMGTDKGLLSRNGKTWGEIAAEKLSLCCNHVYLSIHPGQEETYRKMFSSRLLITDDPEIKESSAGPLAGVLTACKMFPQCDLLVLACDMPDMSSALLQKLVAAYHKDPYHSCYAYGNGKYFEPLCAIYTQKILQSVLNKLSQPTPTSLQQILQQHDTFYLPVKPEEKLLFRNYNSVDFLNSPKIAF